LAQETMYRTLVSERGASGFLPATLHLCLFRPVSMNIRGRIRQTSRETVE
jgi:hypothetical protein